MLEILKLIEARTPGEQHRVARFRLHRASATATSMFRIG
jgi:hypothetical protein